MPALGERESRRNSDDSATNHYCSSQGMSLR
jgi:hypothetical protein